MTDGEILDIVTAAVRRYDAGESPSKIADELNARHGPAVAYQFFKVWRADEETTEGQKR